LAALLVWKFSVDEKIEETVTVHRMNDLQVQYYKLVALLVAAEPSSVSSLRDQLEQTRRELILLKEERSATEAAPSFSQLPAPSSGRENAALKRKSPSSNLKPANIASAPVDAPRAAKRNSDDLDDLLGGPYAVDKQATDTTLPGLFDEKISARKSLSRPDIQKGMQAVAQQVKQCGNGNGGLLVVSVSIVPSGKVSQALVTGAFATGEVGKCAAEAVRSARFPASERNTSIKYTFQL
jgi:hypothetical protein